MGSCSCTRRHFLLSTCFLQMITIIERQVFDFLGYMWAPILVNFFQILFIIFGFYGAYHFRIKYIITYLVWNFIWIGWNAFLICFYLNVGGLDRDSDLLNMGTGSFSWFEANGYGCKPTYNITTDDPFRPLRPERVEDCLLDYPLVEVAHSGVQCALALLGILGAILISCIFLDEDDRSSFTPSHLTHTSGNNSLNRHKSSQSRSSSERRKRHYQSKPSPMSMSVSTSMSPQSAQTTPSLSYASLQNSNPQLAASASNSNSNYSIFQAATAGDSSSTSGHFARIHHKPKPPKSLPDVKYTQLALERLSRNLEEDEDAFSLQHLSPSDNGVTYVPFQSPTPNSLFVGGESNNNATQPHIVFNAYQAPKHASPNNNVSNHYLSYSPKPLRRPVPRPTQIPLPTVPIHSCQADTLLLSPPPPPAARPHIFQPRLGQAPYPDLSPEIAEKYAMPTQHVHGSPMVRRSQRRQPRPQPNFCDQIRDAPPGYIVRTHSDDCLEEQQLQNSAPHVNRRSNRKARPRSFCNSIVGAQA
ncbi:NKAIN [Drosophila busckii]|uniref:Sodium/potassium-transporting ATPase subunit beta-1-interacting protein n=1 Tax=Drosophila busckii TaxID=30019 RepID=A0A0M4EV47_DROBS|nr:NKAIN [Drosophila busckii]